MMFHYHKPILGIQIIVEADFLPQQIDTYRSVLSSQEETLLIDTHIQFDLNRLFFTVYGNPNALLDAVLTFINYYSETFNLSSQSYIYLNYFVLSGLQSDELKAYVKLFSNALLEYDINLKISQLIIPHSYYQIISQPDQIKANDITKNDNHESNIHLLIDCGNPHIFFNMSFNTFQKNKVSELSDQIFNHTKEINGIPLSIEKTFHKEVFRTDYNYGQCMLEILDYKNDSLFLIYEAFINSAKDFNLIFVNSEFIGCIPQTILLEAGEYFYQKQSPKRILNDDETTEFGALSFGMYQNFEKTILFDYHIKEYIQTYQSKSLTYFCSEMARPGQAPGGGSSAAYTGALACATTLKVVNITLGNKKLANLHKSCYQFGEKLKVLQNLFLDSVDLDAEVLSMLLNNYKILNNNEDKNKQRKQSILHKACLAPLEIIKLCSSLAEILSQIVNDFSFYAISDVGVAAELTLSTANAAYYNILINMVNDIDDKEAQVNNEAENLLKFIEQMVKDTLITVKTRIREKK